MPMSPSRNHRVRSAWRRLAGLLALAAVAALAQAVAPSTASAADLTPVTVRITRVVEVEDQDGDGTDGDFYAEVDIDGQGFQTSSRIEDDDFNPDALSPTWRFTRTVDRETTGPVDITIRLKDYDDGLAGGDDIADISPRNDDVELNIRFNPYTGRWDVSESDVQGPVAEGDGDHGFPEANDGRIARIEFQIFTGSNPDVDGDGIPDSIEINGVRRPDNSFAADLKAMGANPCQRTILLEVDWMQGAADGHNHRPKDAALAEIQNAFANAPLPAPGPCGYQGYSSAGGIQLLIDRSNAIPEAAVYNLGDLAATRGNAANFDPLRRPYFHYTVFGHDQAAGSSSSGLCCSEGKDFIVTLGSWNLGTVCVNPGGDNALNTTAQGDDQVAGTTITYGADGTCNTTAGNGATGGLLNDDIQALAVGVGAADAQVGTVRDQSGTIMHELGHSLGLAHRGRDDVNHAPNYLSNMSYLFQAGIPLAAASGSRLDYSGAVLPTLTEAALDETAILDPSSPYNTLWFDPTGQLRIARASQPINWDQAAGPTTVRVDVNFDAGCIAFGANGSNNSTLGGDDQIVNGRIDNGVNDTCESTRGGDDQAITTGVQGTPLNQTCVGTGANERRDSTAAVDDITFTNAIHSGPNLICETTAGNDDIQVVPVGRSEPPSHPGWNDWANIRFRAVDSPNATGAGAGHPGDPTFADSLWLLNATTRLLDPDLRATKSVDLAVAGPGDTLTYTATATNIGTGEASEVRIVDTMPLGTPVVSRSVANLRPGQAASELFTYVIPCGTANGTVLVNSATVSGKDLQAQPEMNTSNNTATASTTVRAPVMTLVVSATGTVNAGEAITYQLAYANTGGAEARSVVVTDTVPADVYYSLALDQGAGPRPSSVTANADGTRTLRWTIGTVAAGESGVIEFTARPTLLATPDRSFLNQASLVFTDANGCSYPPVNGSATTGITEVTPSQDLRSQGFWSQHGELWSVEWLARIQATDQRYDNDGSGNLLDDEVRSIFLATGSQPTQLRQQLLALYFNLASRGANASTPIVSRTAGRLGVTTVGGAAWHAIDTLALPVTAASRSRYSDATTLVEEINTGKSPVF